jgi:hypothetical protein
MYFWLTTNCSNHGYVLREPLYPFTSRTIGLASQLIGFPVEGDEVSYIRCPGASHSRDAVAASDQLVDDVA